MVLKTSPKTPVICVTAHRDEAIAANLNKVNVRHILYKPIDSESLANAVQAALAEAEKG